MIRLILLASLISLNVDAGTTDWSQPPLACVEDLVPSLPSRPCPDLSDLQNPLKDTPNLPEDELVWWNNHKPALPYCRAQEVMRRESVKPGSMTSAAIELSWMRIKAVEQSDVKIQAVYNSSEKYQVPPHILTGAIMQESIFANLGIADDGGNFSCGIAQINLTEWCNWVETLSKEKKSQMNWPINGVKCGSEAVRSFVKPFYDAGLKKLGSLPTYRLEPRHTQNIPYDTVASEWPELSEAVKKRRYQIANSFLNYCASPSDAITAKAYQLKLLYNSFVPKGLKAHEVYRPSEKFGLKCERPLNSKVYPVQVGWLVAVGAYNAGPKVQDAMASSNNWVRADVAEISTFANYSPDDRIEPGFTAQDLIASIYHVGEYNPKTKRMEFLDLSGKLAGWTPFKICILQRHIARVVQHVTRADVTPLVTSLEGSAGCKP